MHRALHRIKGRLCYLFEGFSRVLLSDPRDPKGYLSVSTEDGFWQSAAVSAGSVPTMRESSVAVRMSHIEVNLFCGSGGYVLTSVVVREAELRRRVTRVRRCLNSQDGWT